MRRRILVTGHTGFTGAWVSIWLNKLGAEVIGYALDPETYPNLFKEGNLENQLKSYHGDIRDVTKLNQVVKETKPEFILHLAAQPLVRRGYRIPGETFEVNVQGTINVLDAAIASNSVEGILCITTDKVYKNNDSGTPFKEEDELGGTDPYSASKAAAEIAINSYRESFFGPEKSGKSLVVARGGNIIGGGDWSEDRLIPDFIRAWQGKSNLEIRFPDATRPWQHVLALVDGYLKILDSMASGTMSELSPAYNFGPLSDESVSVGTLVKTFAELITGVEIRRGDTELKERQRLELDSLKAVRELGWTVPWDTRESIRRTADWYSRFYAGADAQSLCLEQIDSWEQAKIKLNGEV